jgi:hypothetical protein
MRLPSAEVLGLAYGLLLLPFVFERAGRSRLPVDTVTRIRSCPAALR